VWYIYMLFYPMNERSVDVDEDYVKIGKRTVRRIYRALNVLAF
jgi:hypothetical protein